MCKLTQTLIDVKEQKNKNNQGKILNFCRKYEKYNLNNRTIVLKFCDRSQILCYVGFLAVLWGLWIVRNNIVFLGFGELVGGVVT